MDMYWEISRNLIIYCPPDVYAGLLAVLLVTIIGTGFYFDGAFNHSC